MYRKKLDKKDTITTPGVIEYRCINKADKCS